METLRAVTTHTLIKNGKLKDSKPIDGRDFDVKNNHNILFEIGLVKKGECNIIKARQDLRVTKWVNDLMPVL